MCDTGSSGRIPTSRPFGSQSTIADGRGALPVGFGRMELLEPPKVDPPKLRELDMGRYLLLWLLGVPIPILVLIWAFGGLS
jgi:hypothetical protein